MPEILVYAVEGRSAEQKRTLMVKITEAVVESFGVDKDRVVVSVIETKAADITRGGVLYSERKK
ncbi:tautomerase family protein [Pantoea dispersa]|uniref:tautomerase family protein n=1 Tax=Pantoea dispersa TaxID=59814 RepID=UPI000FDA8BF2|nr:tautomerase family protein [Pantoea dispersa]RVU72217.1 4-oxalocrotonate tautomerase [Pantoea dispersa]